MSERQGDVEPDAVAPQTDQQPADEAASGGEPADAAETSSADGADGAGDVGDAGDAGDAGDMVGDGPAVSGAEPVQPAATSGWTPPVYSWPKPAWRSELAEGPAPEAPADLPVAAAAEPSEDEGGDSVVTPDDTPDDDVDAGAEGVADEVDDAGPATVVAADDSDPAPAVALDDATVAETAVEIDDAGVGDTVGDTAAESVDEGVDAPTSAGEAEAGALGDSEPMGDAEPSGDAEADQAAVPEPEAEAEVEPESSDEPVPAAEPAAESDGAQVPAAEPDVAEPEAVEPDVAEPDVAEPDAVEPDVAEPDAVEPEAPEADVPESDSVEAGVAEPVDAPGPELPAVPEPEAEAEPGTVAELAPSAEPTVPAAQPWGVPPTVPQAGPETTDGQPADELRADEPRTEEPPPDEEPAEAKDAPEAATTAATGAPEALAPPTRSLWAPPGDGDTVPPAPDVAARSIWAPPPAAPAAPAAPDPSATETTVLPRVPAEDRAGVTAEPAATTSAATTAAATASPATTPSDIFSRSDATTDDATAPAGRTESTAVLPRVEAPTAGEEARERGRHSGTRTVEHERKPRRRRWVIAGIVAAAVVVLGGLYVGALWLWADRVPPGTTVGGIEIGGQQSDTAVATLEEGLGAAAVDALPVGVADKTTTLDPGTAGLTFDAQATVDSVTGFGLEPARLWRQLFGAGGVEPISTVDRDALATAIEGVTEELSTPYVDGTLAFVDGEVRVTPPADGITLDVPAAVDVVATGWLTQARPLELPTVVDPAVIGQAELDRAVTQLARPLSEGPLTVAVGGQTPELPVDVLTGAASFVPEGEELVLRLDGQLLADAVLARTTNLLTAASDATFTFANGAPTIVPGVPGTMIDPEAIATAVAEAATSDRVAEVELVETDPAESTAELEALGITQAISEFSTPLTSEPRRTRNITNGASKINGMLIRPGEEFNLGDALGPLDAEHGYVQAGAIVNGQHTDAWGGGLSQMSTTTYNAAYFAGFDLVEHHPHSEWFSRYPEGRESTIFTPEINMRWVNNTPYGALIQSWVEGGRVWVRIWSTPYWTVESSTSGRSNVRYPTTVYSQSPTCEAQSAGNPGFTVTVTRRVLLNGEEQSSESWTVTYKPQNAIVCGAPPPA